MKKLTGVLILLVLFFAISSGIAQPPPPRHAEEDRGFRKEIMMLMKLRMIEDLDLTEEQTNSFFPKFNEWQNLRRDYNKEIKEIFIEVDEFLKDYEKSGETKEIEDQLKEKIAEFKNLTKEFHAASENALEKMLNSLTVIQQAKFMIFQEKFENELRETVRKIREQREPEQRKRK